MRVDIPSQISPDLHFDGVHSFGGGQGRWLSSIVDLGEPSHGSIARSSILGEGRLSSGADGSFTAKYPLEGPFYLSLRSQGLTQEEHAAAAASVPFLNPSDFPHRDGSGATLRAQITAAMFARIVERPQTQLEVETSGGFAMCTWMTGEHTLALATDDPALNPLHRVALHLDRPAVIDLRDDISAVVSMARPTQVAFKHRARFWNLMAPLPDGYVDLVSVAGTIVTRLDREG